MADIEPARSDDAAQIARMSRDLIEHGLGWSWQAPRILRCMMSSRHNVVVSRAVTDARESTVAGFGIMEYEASTAHLLLFAVRPDGRRRGLGSQLLEWLEATAIVAGVERIQLEARIDNVPARAFYRRHGYRETGVLAGYYNGREDAVAMARTLRPAFRFDPSADIPAR